MKLKYLLLILIILISSCSIEPEEHPKKEQNNLVDDEPVINEETIDLSNIDVNTPAEPGVVYISMMVHIERVNNDEISEESFNNHVKNVETFAGIINEHNAKVTFEANQAFVGGCKNWDSVILNELYNQGHGLGVHADAGGKAEELGTTQEEFTQELITQKENLEELTGLEMRHVSGICSSLDWVKAAIDAGYQFTTGMVGYCALSMPENIRPQEYQVCPTPQECHGEMPIESKDRLHPWRVSSGDNWLVDDPQGTLVLFPSGNMLPSIGEGKTSELEQDDIEEFTKRLDEAISYSDEGKITDLYVGWSIGSEEIDEETLNQWLDSIQPYIDSGQVKWKTIPEMYDIYVG